MGNYVFLKGGCTEIQLPKSHPQAQYCFLRVFLLLIKGVRETWDDLLTFELNLGNENIRISKKVLIL